jgi:hypothetical protein
MEGGVPETAHYDWTVPQLPAGVDSMQCVLRVRYNITTNDYDSTSSLTAAGGVFDAKYNCNGANDPNCGGNDLTQGQKPRYNRPYVQVFGGSTPELSLAMNTNQLGRTFQDRSYVFEITKRPANIPADAKIWNLNTRGRRGNIVQSYPAVEYDFVPNRLEVEPSDYIHYQWTGSDFNTNRNPNDAEGWRYSDRFNMVQTESPNTQIPLPAAKQTLFSSVQTAKAFALLNQETNGESNVACKAYVAGQNGEQNNKDNCGKLNNAKAHQDFGIQKAPTPGVFHYVSTRNNNFSNRGQKGTIVVRAPAAAPDAGDKLPSYGEGGTGTTAPDFSFIDPPSFGSAASTAQTSGSTTAPTEGNNTLLFGGVFAVLVIGGAFFYTKGGRGASGSMDEYTV